MNRIVIATALIALTHTSAATAQCYKQNFAILGAKLDQNIPEADVWKLAAFQPNNVSLTTCGQESKTGAWTCKIETWGAPGSGELSVFFRKNALDVWVVNSWTTAGPIPLLC